MRLTEKKENGFYRLKKGQEIYGEENGIRLVQIVGEYEDIKEELGIDLITLLKALKQGSVYVKSGNEVDWDIPMSGFQICGDKTNGITLWSQVRLEPKDYGKTWALTKKELL